MLTLLFSVSTAKQVDRLLKTGRVIDAGVLLLVALMVNGVLQQLVQQHQVTTSKVIPMDQPKSRLSTIFPQHDTVHILSVHNLFNSCPFMLLTWVQPGCCQISCTRQAVLLLKSHGFLQEILIVRQNSTLCSHSGVDLREIPSTFQENDK